VARQVDYPRVPFVGADGKTIYEKAMRSAE
jgi:hypothetical protein